MKKGISVVIPTKGRVNILKETLNSLISAIETFKGSVEIIIVDDSLEKDVKIIKSFCEEHNFSYFYCDGGVSDKRNFGIIQSQYSIVLFIDSDCTVDENIFVEHLNCYENQQVGGCLGLTEFIGKESIASDITEMMPFLYPSHYSDTLDYTLWGPCTNISYLRSVLTEVKGFSSFLPPKEGGEDVDLGYKVIQEGYKIKCNKKARVYHSRKALRGWTGLVERAFRWGRAEAHLLVHHQKHSFIDTPKYSHVFLLVLFVSIILSYISNTFSLLLLPFLWILFVATFYSLFIVFKPSKNTIKIFAYSFISIFIDLIYEFGTFFELGKINRLELLTMTFVYEESQLYDRWHRGKIKIWSFVVSFFVIYLLYPFLYY